MRVQRRRNCFLTVGELEGRTLLAAQAASGLWLGQDGHDVVGATIWSPPNQIQDMHIAISNLPTDRTVSQVTVIGDGGGLWTYNRSWSTGSAGWIQSPGATTADLYLDPYMVEVGRKFFVNLVYDDGSTAGFEVRGGPADPNLWMPGTTVTAQWVGQEVLDLTGPGPAVGPDGVQDVHLTLANLSTQVGVAGVKVTAPSGANWGSGTNPELYANAELRVRADDPTKADLYFNPVAGLTGQTLTVTVVYTSGKSSQVTVVAGSSDPNLRMPTAPMPVVNWGTLTAGWIGQDGVDLAGAGSVRITVGGLPAGRSVVSASISDGSLANWSYQAVGGSSNLAFRRSTTNTSQADLGFLPIRDESGETLTLVVTLDDGSIHAVRFAGGAVDLSRLAPLPAATSILARPGDDLASLVTQYGTIHLTAGVYQVSRPLFLSYAITITADPNATIVFAQGANDPAWVTAINIEAGNTTLDGFAVRFAGPIRWQTSYNGGPSVIGNSDRINGGYKSQLVNIRLTHLDLMSPPPSSSWEEAPRLIWMTNARGGVISDNLLRGGTTEFGNGPWLITGNTYQGTPPNSYASAVFAGHYTYDTVIANNTAQPVGVSGKTWRFLVLTQAGYRAVVRDNQVTGIGPMDDDSIPHPNAPEVILTEAYRIHFEGAPSAISADGWVVQIPYLQGTAPGPGAVVSVLAGPDAGQWRTVAQVLSPTTFLLDAPISAANQAVTVSTGFVNARFEGNTIDSRGSSMASNMILAGNHFGTQVIGNHLLGGAQGLRITTAATETPVMWGWSRTPMFGILVQDNTLEDNLQAGIFEVEQSAYTKRSKDRTYMSITLNNNKVVWTDAFVAAQSQAGRGLPTSIMVGNPLTFDPTGLLLNAQGNAFLGPADLTTPVTWRIYAATLNGQAAQNQAIVFVPAYALDSPTQLGLVHDTGLSAFDGVTNDGRLQFAPVAGAAGYEYSLSGAEDSFVSIGSATSFLPEGLVQGTNTVIVRAIDATGRRGASASFRFVFDTVAPGAVANLTAFPDGRVQFDAAGPDEFYEYRLDGADTYDALGTATSFSTAESLNGPRTVRVRSIDLAGNIGPDAITTIAPHGELVPQLPAGPQIPPATPTEPQATPTTPATTTPAPAAPAEPVVPGVVVTPPNLLPKPNRPAAWRHRGLRWPRPTRTIVHPRPLKAGQGTEFRSKLVPRKPEGHAKRIGLKQRLRALLLARVQNRVVS